MSNLQQIEKRENIKCCVRCDSKYQFPKLIQTKASFKSKAPNIRINSAGSTPQNTKFKEEK